VIRSAVLLDVLRFSAVLFCLSFWLIIFVIVYKAVKRRNLWVVVLFGLSLHCLAIWNFIVLGRSNEFPPATVGIRLSDVGINRAEIYGIASMVGILGAILFLDASTNRLFHHEWSIAANSLYPLTGGTAHGSDSLSAKAVFVWSGSFLLATVCFFHPTLLSMEGYGYVQCPDRSLGFCLAVWWSTLGLQFSRHRPKSLPATIACFAMSYFIAFSMYGYFMVRE